jgi:hypothetical protein
MKKLILWFPILYLNLAFGQIVADKLCDEKNLSPVKGPIPYGPRIINPPDHDLPADPGPLPVHKGINLEIWHQAADNFQVGGMALLANGTMLELDYDGKLYHVTGLDSAEKVTRRLLPTPVFPEALGLLVRNNRDVFINTATSIWTYDFDGTNLTQEKELLKIPKRGGWYGWNSDLEADDTYLYAGLSSRGTISQYNFKTGTWVMDYGMAMRNTHGMGKDDSGKIWFSDNQGNYRPATPIFMLKQGKSYGVPTQNWTTGAAAWQGTLGPDADLEPYKMDMLWIPYNEMSHSATDIHFMKSGPFKGQALVGDNRTGHLNRLIFESVNGQMQGTVIRMTGGLEAGNYRIVEDAKGNFYLGGLGTPRNTYWVWCEKPYGLQKLTFKTGFMGSTAYNDVHTVSLVKDGIVVTFTSDISADFLNPTNYRTYTFNYIKSVSGNYGGPKADSVGAKIQSIAKRSNREIMISVNGLLKESLLAIEFGSKLTMDNNLQSYEMYYTMNQLSTRVPTDIAPVGEKLESSAIQLSLQGNFLYVAGMGKLASDFQILDLTGKVYSQVSFAEMATSGKVDISTLNRGVYILKLKVGKQSMVNTFLLP